MAEATNDNADDSRGRPDSRANRRVLSFRPEGEVRRDGNDEEAEHRGAVAVIEERAEKNDEHDRNANQCERERHEEVQRRLASSRGWRAIDANVADEKSDGHDDPARRQKYERAAREEPEAIETGCATA